MVRLDQQHRYSSLGIVMVAAREMHNSTHGVEVGRFERTR